MVNIKRQFRIPKGYILIESIIALGLSALITSFLLDGFNQFIINKKLLINQVLTIRTIQERKNQLEISNHNFEIDNGCDVSVTVSADNWSKIRMLKIEGREIITFKILE